MLYSDASAFFLAQVAFALSPGPLIVMLIVRAAGNDVYGALSYTLGASMGVAAIILVVVAGLGAVYAQLPWMEHAGKAALVVYFIWLAQGMWRKGISLTPDTALSAKSLLSSAVFGFGLAMMSPHVVMFNSVMVPDLLANAPVVRSGAGWAIGLGFVSFMVTFGIVIGFAARIAGFLADPSRAQAASRTLASTLILAGGWIVLG